MPAGIEKRVLSLLGEVIGLLELDELSYGLLRGLREAVPSGFCATPELPAPLPHTISLTDPPASPAQHRAFARYAPQNPTVARRPRVWLGPRQVPSPSLCLRSSCV